MTADQTIEHSNAASSRALGAVLVGGASTRFGSDKAAATFGQRTLLVHQLATLAGAGVVDRVYVGGPARPEVGDARHVVDLFPGQGPLGAIITTLTAAAATRGRAQAIDMVVVLAVDVPLVKPATIRRLINAVVATDAHLANDAAVAFGQRDHWTCLAIRTAALNTLHATFGQGERAVHRAFSLLRVTRIDGSEDEFLNINDRAMLDSIVAQRDERR